MHTTSLILSSSSTSSSTILVLTSSMHTLARILARELFDEHALLILLLLLYIVLVEYAYYERRVVRARTLVSGTFYSFTAPLLLVMNRYLRGKCTGWRNERDAYRVTVSGLQSSCLTRHVDLTGNL